MARFRTRKNHYKLTDIERILLDTLPESNKLNGYIARNPKGNLTIYLDEPYQNSEGIWVCNDYTKGFPYPHHFSFITDKPLRIADILTTTYVEDNDYFTPKDGETYFTVGTGQFTIQRNVWSGTKGDLFSLLNNICYPTYKACRLHYDEIIKFYDGIYHDHREATE
jgi:hypothetical protein